MSDARLLPLSAPRTHSRAVFEAIGFGLATAAGVTLEVLALGLFLLAIAFWASLPEPGTPKTVSYAESAQ